MIFLDETEKLMFFFVCNNIHKLNKLRQDQVIFQQTLEKGEQTRT